ncbi:hypothetical protein [Nocardia sp. CC227C]|uniref:hypothetical protein n=1 Tax=Nocardia sp. CC227C TaxID=3044562 RepID=UPI00278C6967|nr:hypothetical protein [Nocardia sp. CC227C]
MELRQQTRPPALISKRLVVLATVAAASVGVASLLVSGTGPGITRNHQQIPCPEPAALEIWTGGVRYLVGDARS